MTHTPPIYGNLPIFVGDFPSINTDEMMFWLYCPIKIPGHHWFTYPQNLEKYLPLMEAVSQDTHFPDFINSYVYLTAKTLWVNPENPGNRAGWHSDGFLTDDINYIWYDSNPTIFFNDGKLHSFTSDHEKSLGEMDDLCEPDESHHYQYGNCALFKLDQTVLHKVNTDIGAGVRTFVKLSVSTNKYQMIGNSTNEKLTGPNWNIHERGVSRNCPTGSK